MIARVAVTVAAVLVLGWLAVMERDTRLQARGVSAAAAHPPRLAGAEADLRRARLLNPDTQPDLARALVYQAAGRPAAARSLLASIVRREPENLVAWGTLLAFSRREDPATARRALAAVRRLDPLTAPRR